MVGLPGLSLQPTGAHGGWHWTPPTAEGLEACALAPPKETRGYNSSLSVASPSECARTFLPPIH